MPLFDFQCAECQTTFEELVRSPASQAQVRCVKCGSSRVERLLSVFAAGASRSGGASRASAPPSPRRPGGG